ncbi:B3 DNA binding domain-containing protein [Cynara cardunculus var. scolymus]|uniref:B3 DNA binding domain-containing protein n=1 Tax=Cynara cardunculus var. scolymus TaxID=59895 RepID=A0A124SFM5_CYNCS|nr:B3 DNA binding domain-containing protein [Cynara cardunculus var. scolymus]
MSSPVKICMNGLCGATTTPQWKRGWPMKAGGFATLCYPCGYDFPYSHFTRNFDSEIYIISNRSTYDNLNYCERFHLNEPGWRECKFCDKPVHCGCVVSKYLHECLDLGGISCIKCARSKAIQPLKQSVANEIPNGFARFSGNWHPSVFSNQMNNGTSFDKGKLAQLNEGLEKHQKASSTSSIGRQFKQEEPSSGEFGIGTSSNKDAGSSFRNHPLPLSSIFQNQLPLVTVPDTNKPKLGFQQSFGLNLGTPSSSIVPTSNGIAMQEKVPTFKQEQRPHQMLSKPSKSGVSVRSQTIKGMGSDNRVARAPAEGRGRSQLLPRYWPKITDQELLNANCTITPLFEKVLSASDAGRIGRLVLPKACAEVCLLSFSSSSPYFYLQILDKIKLLMQAYFPPINQSEGLPIKIRDIKGKEWTFQFRFWPNNNSRMYVLEGVTPCIQNMQLQAGDTVIFSRLDPEDKLVIGCRKAIIPAGASALPNAVNGANTEREGMTNWDPVTRPAIQEKKKARTIGLKSKRLHMHSEDAMELKFTWEEAQDFLRPPPAKPTVVVIENFELEEYDNNGFSVIVAPNGGSYLRMCSCSAPEEKEVGDLDRILRLSKESKKRKITENWETEDQQLEPSGLDALATAAVLGTNGGELGESLVGPTTRHPRHRPGCTCIVCIQPPSGKGKHKPTCICNVCSTVRRRFKTLMLRKRKRLSEPDGETGQKSLVPLIKGSESVDGLGTGVGIDAMSEGSNKGQELDLNCDPKEEEMLLAEAANASSIPSQWHNMLEGPVPNAYGMIADGGFMVVDDRFYAHLDRVVRKAWSDLAKLGLT